LIGYLHNNRDRLGYAKRRQEGLPIGSGGIESANKYISHAQLKRSGAWSLIPNGNNVLRLRCAIYNGTYGPALQRYIINRHPQGSSSGTNGYAPTAANRAESAAKCLGNMAVKQTDRQPTFSARTRASVLNSSEYRRRVNLPDLDTLDIFHLWNRP
jgi:hypothetical protein